MVSDRPYPVSPGRSSEPNSIIFSTIGSLIRVPSILAGISAMLLVLLELLLAVRDSFALLSNTVESRFWYIPASRP